MKDIKREKEEKMKNIFIYRLYRGREKKRKERDPANKKRSFSS